MIKLTHEIINDKYTQYVYDNLDIQNQDETIVEIPMIDVEELKSFKWNIGLIYGGSGVGKTTILNELGQIKDVTFDKNKSLISNFDWLTPSEASRLLTSMGLSSIPTWLRPFHTLSNGEQYRAKMAYLIGSVKEGETVLVDEFTSVVDRDVARAMSFAIQKYIKKHNIKLIVASCHYDIFDWLLPCWIFTPSKYEGRFERTECHRQSRPKIELTVSRTETHTWNIFKKHHYLTEKLNKSCKCFLFEWNGKPVAFVAVINRPRKGCSNAMGLSRTVVLPDYQGMGIGSQVSNFIASVFTNNDMIIYTKTVNPAIGIYRNNSDDWKGTTWNGRSKTNMKCEGDKYKNRLERMSFCHQYVGSPTSGYEHLLLPIKDMRKNKKNSSIKKLF